MSYEQQEITEMKWIHGYHNLADFMTKAKPLLASKMLIDLNNHNINTTEWVEQASWNQAGMNK